MLHALYHLPASISLSVCVCVLCCLVCDWSTKKSATSRARNQAKQQKACKGSQLKANADALQIQCAVSENKIELRGFESYSFYSFLESLLFFLYSNSLLGNLLREDLFLRMNGQMTKV